MPAGYALRTWVASARWPSLLTNTTFSVPPRGTLSGNRTIGFGLIAEDFRFFSPWDNGLDRGGYFAICWPNSERFQDFKLTDAVADGERVFVTYEVLTRTGDRFRNAEVLTVRNGRISAAEVYFGWDIPHRVAHGQHGEAHGQNAKRAA